MSLKVLKPPVVIPKVPIAPVFDPFRMREAMLFGWDEAVKLGERHEVIVNSKPHQHVHIQRGSKVLGVAHLDTKLPFKNFWLNRNYVGCQTIDNHLGLWVLMYGLKAMGITVDLLLCDEEETGCSTSQDFKLPQGMEYNWMVSFDRTGTDCALYQYNTPEFVKTLAAFDIEGVQGAYSDIDSAGHLGILGMNMGCGMYDYHGPSSYANLWELGLQMRRFYHFHEAYKDTKLPYEQPQWKKFHRTRTWGTTQWQGHVGGHKPLAQGTLLVNGIPHNYLYEDGESDEELYWRERLRDSWPDEKAATPGEETEEVQGVVDLTHLKPRVSENDVRSAEIVYADLLNYGRDGNFFGNLHPVSWCSTYAKADNCVVGAIIYQCHACTRKWLSIHTRWCFTTEADYCRYCYCSLMESLGLMPSNWFDLAATYPERRKKGKHRERRANANAD